jgi:hypothetical protein
MAVGLEQLPDLLKQRLQVVFKEAGRPLEDSDQRGVIESLREGGGLFDPPQLMTAGLPDFASSSGLAGRSLAWRASPSALSLPLAAPSATGWWERSRPCLSHRLKILSCFVKAGPSMLTPFLRSDAQGAVLAETLLDPTTELTI